MTGEVSVALNGIGLAVAHHMRSDGVAVLLGLRMSLGAAQALIAVHVARQYRVPQTEAPATRLVMPYSGRAPPVVARCQSFRTTPLLDPRTLRDATLNRNQKPSLHSTFAHVLVHRSDGD